MKATFQDFHVQLQKAGITLREYSNGGDKKLLFIPETTQVLIDDEAISYIELVNDSEYITVICRHFDDPIYVHHTDAHHDWGASAITSVID